MAFTPHTPAEIESMLRAIGFESIDDLFKDIPVKAEPAALADLPERHPEMDVVAECRRLAGDNCGSHCYKSFLGAGAYEHFIPSAIDHILRRGEFFTAYTPYQAEASQGTLRAIYQYQSIICSLTGLDVSNASLYDGASAAAEAVLMAWRSKRRPKIALAPGLHPAYRRVIETYTKYVDVELVDLSERDGVCDVEALGGIDIGDGLAGVVLAQPNALGCIEPAGAIADWAHEKGGLCIAVVNPMSLGVLKAPGDWGADIAVGDGQPFGIPLSFGGPYVGFIAVRKALVRMMPGRLAGRTVDVNGKDGFVLTLQTREQHIRRERATSNICTNQALCALAVTLYLSLIGKSGLPKMARLNLDRSHYLFDKVTALDGVEAAWDQPFFNEFVLRLPKPAEDVCAAMKERGILAGLPLARWPGNRDNNLLLTCATETKSQNDCDEYAKALAEVL